jgi:hypothetical protein
LHPSAGGARMFNQQNLLNSSITETGLLPEQVFIYPNPAQNNLSIIVPSRQRQTVKFELRDLLGRVIYSNFITSGTEEQLSLKGISNGVYLIVLKDNKGQMVYQTKIVKQD